MSLSGNIETGTSRNQYLTMSESPELRWGFFHKFYAILTIQLLFTVAVGALVVKFYPTLIYHWSFGFLLLTNPFLCKAFVLIFPLNHVLLAIYTISVALVTGLTCSFTHGKVILEAAILTTVVVVSLTLLTFFGPKRDHDFRLLGPFLFAALYILLIFGLIQIFIPTGILTHLIYGGTSALLFCGYIVFDTFNLIKLFSDNNYILAAAALYLDVLNLFLALLIIFSNILVTLRRI